ncbi:unnamed protein product [Strongylus vulgaris]|uniref:Tyrosine-protein phosphatase domain-containing protein n=1 Tax=Strongylus vulgaris TaxID=40348 RepID=A0A3P7KVQ2_STRVU|nr:unnamed protein product [Strongylus vulgaris]
MFHVPLKAGWSSIDEDYIRVHKFLDSRLLCRYNDIICIDATRVVLKDRPPDDDYIHASWMTMPDGQKYICTQGPLLECLDDFWHMITSEKSKVIVMLCNFNEG